VIESTAERRDRRWPLDARGDPEQGRRVVDARFPSIAAGLVGAAAMTVCLGPSLVNPTNIEWLMHGDYRLHFLGWHLYRHGPWTLPLGAAPLLIWPIGSSTGLTDSIPIAGFVFKLIDPLLPATFQFIGLWLVLCFALQGFFGALIVQLATPRALLQFLGGLLFILSPPLIYRIVHAALTAHWLILWALWLALREDAGAPSRRLCVSWTVLLVLAAAIQPYILLMIVVLMLAAYLQQAFLSPRRIAKVASYAVIGLACAGVILWQSGSFMVRSESGLTIGGFGGWSANLLTFLMPTEASTRLSPGLFAYQNSGQYEGYAYLGAGTLLLLVVAFLATLPRLFSRAPWAAFVRRLPLVLALLFLAAMAVGPFITLGSRTVFAYPPAWWGPLTIFRTHGRMIWPLFYAFVALALYGATRLPPRVAITVCIAALAVQAFDLAAMTRYVADARSYGFRDPLQSGFWSRVATRYKRLILVPSNLCTREGFVDYSAFSLLAGRSALAINAGITARYDVDRAKEYCDELNQELRAGPKTAGSLYIVRPDLVSRLAHDSAPGTICTLVDGFGVCFSAESYADWQDTFDVVRSRLPSTEELVRFYDGLNDAYWHTLKRAPHVASPGALRIEGLARYLAYRAEGCDDGEAVSKTLARVTEKTSRGFCGALATTHELPPADQTFAFARTLEARLRETPAAAPAETFVDLEGEAVWLSAYVGQRLRGAREQDARESVLAAVTAATR
jgi:hypothetical protein